MSSAGVALSWASAAAAQMRVAPLTDIYESYNDCFAATKSGIDAGALESRGWARATVDREPATNPAIFGHGARAALVMLEGDGHKRICIVMARLENDEAFSQRVSAWDGLRFDYGGDAWFSVDGHPVSIARTGSTAEPSVRLIAGPPMEEES